MNEAYSQPILAVSLTYEQLGQCVDIARSVNELSYRMPGMLWRKDWAQALSFLEHIDPNNELGTVLDVLAARLAFHNEMDDPVPVGLVDDTGFRRFQAEDLVGMRDLLVHADRVSVEALSHSRIFDDEVVKLLAAALSHLLLTSDMLRDERQTLGTWLRSGRGLHGSSVAMSNCDFVQHILEALEDITFTHRGWPPQWRRLMLVNRTWRDAVCAVGRYVALPPSAFPDVVETALCMLPSTRMMICTLTDLSASGAGGLACLLDLLRGAQSLTTLRIADWIQCDASVDADHLSVVVLPRVRDFELIGTPRPAWMQKADPSVSLVRYLRLPMVECAILSEPVEYAGSRAEIPDPLRRLAEHLEAIASALVSSSPCIRETQQYTVSSDTRNGGLVLRTRRALGSCYDGMPAPLTIHLYPSPGGLPGANLSSCPIAMHLFVCMCQTLAPIVTLGNQPHALPLDSLSVVNVLTWASLEATLPYHPPWEDQDDCRRILLGLPIYKQDLQVALSRPARIVLFLDSHPDGATLLPFKLLGLRPPDRIVGSPPRLKELRVEHIELDGEVSAQFQRQKVWQASEFQDALRTRAARGFHTQSIALTGKQKQWQRPIQELQEAARTWGRKGTIVKCQSQNNGVLLVFQRS
ncbi:unnamed protein product [Peniophora sp. CBMAI 1063]|nr:unnamed protein product [Peniophora sp. CBMAI 1063]